MASQAALQERLAAVQQWDDDESDGGADEEEIALPAATVTTSSKRKRGRGKAAAAAAAATSLSGAVVVCIVQSGHCELAFLWRRRGVARGWKSIVEVGTLELLCLAHLRDEVVSSRRMRDECATTVRQSRDYSATT